jgi:hypothetical protein
MFRIHSAGPEVRSLSTGRVLVSGLMVSLFAGSALVGLRLGGLDGERSWLAGAIAGLIAVPVAVTQLTVLRLRPRPRLVSPLQLHAIAVPWLAALAFTAALAAGLPLLSGSPVAFSDSSATCLSFDEMVKADWALHTERKTPVGARLHDGRQVYLYLGETGLRCDIVSTGLMR